MPRRMLVATTGAANGDMSAAEKDSLRQIILNRAALGSTYAAMLQQTGVLKGDLNDPDSWRIDFSVAAGGQSDLDRLIDSVDTLSNVLAQIFHININHDELSKAPGDVVTLLDNLGLLDQTDTTTNTDFPGIEGAIGDLDDVQTKLNNLDGRVTSTYVNTYMTTFESTKQANLATGGVANFATGGMVHLAELGPEMLRFPSGAIGMAYHEGNYMVPSGTHVDTAAATASTINSQPPSTAPATSSSPVRFTFSPPAPMFTRRYGVGCSVRGGVEALIGNRSARQPSLSKGHNHDHTRIHRDGTPRESAAGNRSEPVVHRGPCARHQ